MADGRHGCCCTEFVCDEYCDCPVYEPWCFQASATHRIETWWDGKIVYWQEETIVIHNAEMVWDPIYCIYVCIGGTASYKCESKSKTYPCGNYVPPARTCEGCDPAWCSVNLTEANNFDLAGAGSLYVWCNDPCNNREPCWQNFQPTNEMVIDLFNIPAQSSTTKLIDTHCCMPGYPVGVDGPYNINASFKGRFWGKPGCFRPWVIGGLPETFDEWSYEPWALCYYDAPEWFGIRDGYLLTGSFYEYPGPSGSVLGSTIGLCGGGYVYPYECIGDSCPRKVAYNLMKPYEWEAQSCLSGLANPYTAVCFSGNPPPYPWGNTTLDCQEAERLAGNLNTLNWHLGGAYFKHSLTTSMQTGVCP